MNKSGKEYIFLNWHKGIKENKNYYYLPVPVVISGFSLYHLYSPCYFSSHSEATNEPIHF